MMSHPTTPPRSSALRGLLALAFPVISVQLGMMAMGVVDTIMVGHVSPTALASVAVGNLYYYVTSIFAVGALMALDPVVAQAVGARDDEAVARGVQRGMVLAALLCLPTILLLAPAPVVLRWLRQPGEVIPLAGAYAQICIPGVFGMFAFVVLRQSLQALARVRPIVLTILIANLMNVGLNYILIFGHLGFPPLGVQGAAWSTTISRLAMGPILLAFAWAELRPVVLPFRRAALERKPLLRMAAIGAPIGVAHQLEYGVFGLVGLLMGSLGTAMVAGHQIALNLASVTFMVPLGLSSAAAVVVGHAVGRGDRPAARASARAALGVAVAFMGTTAMIFLLFPGPLARVYSGDAPVLTGALSLIPLAGVFQVFDGIQVTSIGILRGLGDTRTPMVTAIAGYWLLGLPVSLWLGLHLGHGPTGLWWGLVLGLAIVAVFLIFRVHWKLRQPLIRLRVEGPASDEHVAVMAGEHPEGTA
ncbi:MAG TPA: MATE family efflux transporter [Gemmatimonadales bacterium]|nr:MATE family efflux transporter [Gemmatimonadales bacterium]